MLFLFTFNFCFFHAQEVAFRAAVLLEWHDDLDFAIREVLPTVCKYHIANITELTMEVEKLERWVLEVATLDSFFQR